ncbi:MAG: DUF4198 domain-containing protein [Polyangia bacterium]
MFRSRRNLVVALAAFLLAFVPATTSARAQHVRWLELDTVAEGAPHAGVRVVSGTRAGRFYRVMLLRRSDVAGARFIGQAGTTDLASKLREQDLRLLELQAEQLNQSPGWVGVDLTPSDLEWPVERWREFLAAEAVLDKFQPGTEAQVHVHAQTFFKLLVHRGTSAPADAVTRPVGQAIELVPLADPMSLSGNRLQVQVLLKGKPLAGARVYAATTEAPASTSATTDSEGKAKLTVGPGQWVLFVRSISRTDQAGGFEVFGAATTIRVR